MVLYTGEVTRKTVLGVRTVSATTAYANSPREAVVNLLRRRPLAEGEKLTVRHWNDDVAAEVDATGASYRRDVLLRLAPLGATV